jgi:hypothetical protein
MSISVPGEDDVLAEMIAAALLRRAGGKDKFAALVTQIIRRAIDEVIDAARTNRFVLDDLEKTEKTYIGTKIEILFRSLLSLEKGSKLDVLVEGIETDIKYTIGSNWTIPQEALGHPCILIRANEKKAVLSVGVLVIRLERLNASENRDGKRTISKLGFESVSWLLKEHPYPMNFWEELPPALRSAIMLPRGGADRLATLFRNVQRKAISRLIVQAIVQQDDYMKRIRRNGGARDILAPEGIAILWGQKDRAIITDLSLGRCGADEFISVQPSEPAEVQLLRAANHID